MSGQLSVDTLAVRGGYHPQLGDGISPDINLSSTYYLPGDGGGGIVADSETDQEYQESIAKVKVLMETLGQQFNSQQLK